MHKGKEIRRPLRRGEGNEAQFSGKRRRVKVKRFFKRGVSTPFTGSGTLGEPGERGKKNVPLQRSETQAKEYGTNLQEELSNAKRKNWA